MFDLMSCGDNRGCCDGGSHGARGMLEDILRTHGGGLGNGGVIDEAQFPERRDGRGASRANRAVDVLNAVLANNVDPNPTPINSNFPLRAPLDGEIPTRFSTGPQSFEQVSTFGVQPIQGDTSGNQLRTQIRTLLRQLGG